MKAIAYYMVKGKQYSIRVFDSICAFQYSLRNYIHGEATFVDQIVLIAGQKTLVYEHTGKCWKRC